jgi:hypothetical protein
MGRPVTPLLNPKVPVKSLSFMFKLKCMFVSAIMHCFVATMKFNLYILMVMSFISNDVLC